VRLKSGNASPNGDRVIERLSTYPILLLALVASCVRPAPRLQPDTLAQEAMIRRDRFGIPHIYGQSEEAAAYAFGYAQAEDHGPLIVRRLIAARGEESKYFGDSGIENDFAMARLDNLVESRRGLEEVGATFARMLAAYAAGINAWVRQQQTTIAADIPESGARNALRALRLSSWAEVPPFDAADVMASLRAPAVSSIGGQGIVRQLRAKYEGQPAPPPASPVIDEAPGSNALALGGSRTVSGKPILLGNPHLDWSSLYWEAHVTVPGKVNFYGSTLAGLPVLRAGFNDRLGFVQTNNSPDLDDIYRLPLDPSSPEAYLFDGRRHPLTWRDVSIEVRSVDAPPRRESRRYWYSHLGPIVHRDASAVFALRSIRLEAWRYYEGFHIAAAARSLDQFMEAMRRSYVPTSNFTYADADGNILYLWNARLPRRLDDGSLSYDLDVPGLTKYLWRGVHALDDLPRLLNPASGYVQNANSPPRFAALHDQIDMRRYPSYVERGALGLRPQLALRMLEEHARFSTDDVVRLKFETRVLLAERIKGALIHALRGRSPLGEEARAGLETLEAWDDRASARSIGTALFLRFWDGYSAEVRQPFETPWDEGRPVDTPAGLADPAAAIRHLEQAVRSLRETYGSERVAWGEVNRYRIGDVDLPAEGCTGTYGCFRVQRFVPPALAPAEGELRRDAPTRPSREGGGRMGNIAGNLPDGGLVGFGDGWILLVDFSTPVPTAWSLLAYGQTSDLSSRHSRDQIELLATRRLRPAFFTEADIRRNLEREYHPPR
jgi:acyl-homoserine-lactone acylase